MSYHKKKVRPEILAQIEPLINAVIDKTLYGPQGQYSTERECIKPMKFKIKRASTTYVKPCNEAVKISEHEYEIELNNIEELIKLSKRHGPLILEGNGNLLIYDDLIE